MLLIALCGGSSTQIPAAAMRWVLPVGESHSIYIASIRFGPTYWSGYPIGVDRRRRRSDDPPSFRVIISQEIPFISGSSRDDGPTIHRRLMCHEALSGHEYIRHIT